MDSTGQATPPNVSVVCIFTITSMSAVPEPTADTLIELALVKFMAPAGTAATLGSEDDHW